MSVNVDDLRRRFETLTDEALLAISPADLVDTARRCFAEEVAKRGLQVTVPGSGESSSNDLNAEGLAPVNTEEITPGDDWKLLQDFDSPEEVSIAISLLRSAGIAFHTPMQTMSATNSLVGFPADAFHVYVPADALEDARQILDTPISDEELAAQAEAAAPPDEENDEENAEVGREAEAS